MKLLIIIITCVSFISCSSSSKKEDNKGIIPVIKNYDYRKLQVRDYSQMLSLVRNRIARAEEIAVRAQNEGDEAHGEREALILLKNAATIVLTRPNTGNDNLPAKLMPLIHRELTNYDAYFKTMDIIVSASINNLTNKDVPTKFKVGSSFIIENAMSELLPDIKNDPYAKKIFEKIRDAEIDLGSKVRGERLMRAMHKSSSPSVSAKKILEKNFPETKKKGFFSRMFGSDDDEKKKEAEAKIKKAEEEKKALEKTEAAIEEPVEELTGELSEDSE